MIPLQIIRQEADAAFQRHHLCTIHKLIQLFFGQGSRASFDKALRVSFKQTQITGNLRQIRLILRSCTCTEPNRIAKIINGKSRHDGIQINDADALPGLFIQHDVVQLRIIMCHTKRKLSLGQAIHQRMGKRLPLHYKPDLILHSRSTSADICLHGCPEFPKAVRCVVEIRNRLMQCICRIV